MTHFNTMFDKNYIGAWEMTGDLIVKITDVVEGKLQQAGKTKKDRKPVLTLEGHEKKFVCNVTNAKLIAGIYGAHVEKWKGQRITLYKAMTRNPSGGGDVECIRVRPTKPQESSPTGAPTKPKGAPLIGADGSTFGTYESGSAWVDAFEAAMKESAEPGDIWDRNQEYFYKLQARATESDNAEFVERTNAVAKVAAELLKPRTDAGAAQVKGLEEKIAAVDVTTKPGTQVDTDPKKEFDTLCKEITKQDKSTWSAWLDSTLVRRNRLGDVAPDLAAKLQGIVDGKTAAYA